MSAGCKLMTEQTHFSYIAKNQRIQFTVVKRVEALLWVLVKPEVIIPSYRAAHPLSK